MSSAGGLAAVWLFGCAASSSGLGPPRAAAPQAGGSAAPGSASPGPGAAPPSSAASPGSASPGPTSPSAAPVGPSGSASPGPTSPAHSTVVERLDVPGDLWALVSPGAPGSRDVVVYLHGKCGDPDAFRAFLEGVPAHFTVVSLRGEIKCKDGARTRWAGHVPSLDRRIDRAVEAASRGRAVPLRRDRLVVFGYSQGSLRAEALVTKLPDRYPAAILAAGPRAPKDHALDRAGAVVLLAGARDARGHLMKAAGDLSAKGLPVRYVELPEAHHGEYGPAARATLADCFSWIEERVSFTDEGPPFQE